MYSIVNTSFVQLYFFGVVEARKVGVKRVKPQLGPGAGCLTRVRGTLHKSKWGRNHMWPTFECLFECVSKSQDRIILISTYWFDDN